VSDISKFTEDILSVAQEKSSQIIGEAEAETQRAFGEAKAHLSREADDILRDAQTEAEGARRREMSEVRHRLKLQEQSEKSKIVSEVLEATKKHVNAITNDEAKYLPYLVGYIASGIRELGLDSVTVHLNATDLKRIGTDRLQREVSKHMGKPARIECSREAIEAVGGAVISGNDGKTRIVNTFEQRFEAVEPQLLVEAGKLLFGQ
jgi:vacuolar-type H+-ATPase subunit E/Vma4